ncbi:MAG: glycosyltransferase family 87 protein [Terriglobales bacterium]
MSIWLLTLAAYFCVVMLYSAAILDTEYDRRISWIAFIVISAIWFYSFENVAGDFCQFYIAAKIPLHSLYNFSRYATFGKALLVFDHVLKTYAPYLRPPAFAPLLRPLGWFSYWHAFLIWQAAAFVSYVLALRLLFRRFNLPHQLLPAFALFFPALFNMSIGQDINTYLLVLLAGLLCLLDGKDSLAGVLIALCTYKFHLILLIVVALIAHRRWKALGAFGAVSSFLVAVSVALVPPDEYIHELMAVPPFFGLIPNSIRGVLLQSNHANWYVPIALVGVTLCIYLIWRLPLQQGLAVAIVGVLLFGHYGTWPDTTLLAVPIAIMWRNAGPVARKLLLAILVFPPAWMAGELSFRVLAEGFLLFYVAYSAWRDGKEPIAVPAVAQAAQAGALTC